MLWLRTGVKCPIWVISGNGVTPASCPFFPSMSRCKTVRWSYDLVLTSQQYLQLERPFHDRVFQSPDQDTDFIVLDLLAGGNWHSVNLG